VAAIVCLIGFSYVRRVETSQSVRSLRWGGQPASLTLTWEKVLFHRKILRSAVLFKADSEADYPPYALIQEKLDKSSVGTVFLYASSDKVLEAARFDPAITESDVPADIDIIRHFSRIAQMKGREEGGR